jgi:hypothetical protein
MRRSGHGGCQRLDVLLDAGLVVGRDREPTFLASLHDDPPHTMHAVDVPMQHGFMRYLAFSENAARWEIHRGAFELHSWTPTAQDPTRARFARIVLAPTSTTSPTLIKEALQALRTTLHDHDIEAIAGLDPNGAVLWLRFDDRPHYDDLRTWLHTIAHPTTLAHPTIFTHDRDPGRVRIDVGSNAVGRWSPPSSRACRGTATQLGDRHPTAPLDL